MCVRCCRLWNATQLHRQINALREAKRDHRRGEIRRAANAAYRVLTGENATRPGQHAENGNIPGGLRRIDAAAATIPQRAERRRHPRWDRMRNHADKARQNWSRSAPHVDNRGPRHAMSQADYRQCSMPPITTNERAARRALGDEREARFG